MISIQRKSNLEDEMSTLSITVGSCKLHSSHQADGGKRLSSLNVVLFSVLNTNEVNCCLHCAYQSLGTHPQQISTQFEHRRSGRHLQHLYYCTISIRVAKLMLRCKRFIHFLYVSGENVVTTWWRRHLIVCKLVLFKMQWVLVAHWHQKM